MEIKNVAILGNTLEARLVGLKLAISNPDINFKIFTNNESYSNHFKTPIIKKNYSASFLVFCKEQLDISANEIFEKTKSSYSLASAYSNIVENDIIIPEPYRTEFARLLIKYECFSKNFLKHEIFDKQLSAYIEWCIYNNYPVIDSTTFPYEAYLNDPEGDFYFVLDKVETPYDALSAKFDLSPWTRLIHTYRGVLDIENFKSILENKMQQFSNLEWITDSIVNVHNNTYDTSYLEKTSKDIISIECSQIYETDFVINTGVNFDYFNNFIETSDNNDLVSINHINPFTVLKEYTSKIKEKPTVIKRELIDNGMRIHLPYSDRTIIQEYQLTDQPINTRQGKNSNLIFDENVEVTTYNLDTTVNNFLINQKYNSNYIFIDVEKLGVDYITGNSMTALMNFAINIDFTLNAVDLNNEIHTYQYLQNIENSWYEFIFEIQKFIYYLMKDNTVSGLEFYNNIPEKIKNIFDSWNNYLPNFTYTTMQGDTVTNSDSQLYQNSGEINNTVSSLTYGIIAFDYYIISQFKNEIKNFNYDFSNKENIFKDIYYMQKYLYNAYIYSEGFYNHDDFININFLNNNETV